jgi:protein-S-isoprenylcysteine O-methyltransferase Ste14
MATRLVEFGNVCFKRRGLLAPVALILLVLPSPRLSENPVAIGVAGLALAVIGQIIRIVTIGLAYIIRGGKDHRVYAEDLVTTGLYAHTRNPMYLGNLFLLLGLALASNSWVFAVIGTALAVLLHVFIVAAEEDFLRNKFGEEFKVYCARVPRLFPRLSGILRTTRSMQFDWRRVLTKEYAAPVDWLSATAIVALINIWRADQIDDHRGVAAVMLLIILGRLIAWLSVRAKQPRAATPDGARGS